MTPCARAALALDIATRCAERGPKTPAPRDRREAEARPGQTSTTQK